MDSRTVLRRLTWTLVASGGILVVLQLVLGFLVAINSEWNDVRLAPTVALLHGVPLWQPFGEGPVLDAIYGPVAPLTWTPVALASTPTGVLAIGAVESFALLALPMILILSMEARRHAALLCAILVLAFALLLSSPALPSIGVHADVPAIAFATVALWCAWTERRRRSVRWRIAGACFVMLAVGSKQVMAPLLIVYPVWIGLASGWRVARQTLTTMAVMAIAGLGLVVLAFDEVAMFDATILGPSRHPFEGGAPVPALVAAGLDLARRTTPLLILLVCVGFMVWRRSRSVRAAASRNRWLFPLALGIACVPTSLLGGAKLGGAVNALAFTVWFLWLALVAALATTGRRRAVIRRYLTLGAAFAGCVLGIRLAPGLEALGPLTQQAALPTVAFQAASQAPGTIYFPYNTVVTLLTDGRAYHLDPGLQFRDVEGRNVDERYVRAFVPPRMQRVAASRQVMPFVLKLLPRYRRQINDPALSGWTVMTESDLLLEGEEPGRGTLRGELAALLDTSAAAPSDAQVIVESAQVSVPDRSRRPRLRLDASLREAVPHTQLEVEVLLYDRQDHLIQSLVVEAQGGSRQLQAEWPVYGDLLRSAAVAVVLVRAGQPAGARRWRLSGDQVRALVRDSRSAG